LVLAVLSFMVLLLWY